MKKLFMIGAIVLLTTFSAGCQNANSNPGDASPTAETSYFKNKQPDSVSKDQDQLIWQLGDITLTVNQEVANSPEGSSIKEMTLQSKGHSTNISLNQDFSTIDTVTLSPDSHFLAISLSSGGYSSLFIVPVATGEPIAIHEKLQASGVDSLESVESLNWAPDGKTIAFSYGRPGEFHIGFYSTTDDHITSLPDEAAYISVAHLLWSTTGNLLDYIAENPADEWKLHRYNLEDKSVQEVRSLTREELSNFEEYSPQYIGG